MLAALWVLSATLTALVTATVIGGFGAAIPWVGSAISIAMGVIAVSAGIALLAIAVKLLPDLQACLVASAGAATSVAVAIASGVGFVAGVALIAFGGGFLFGALHIPIPVG